MTTNNQKYNYKFGIKHYLNYFAITYKNSLKSMLEYKANFYSSIIIVLFWDLSFLLFGLVFKDNFLPLINWTFSDYCVFLLLTYIIHNISYQFIDNKELERLIPKGNLNTYLYRPGNRFMNYFCDIKFNYLIITIGNVLIFTPFIIYLGEFQLKYIYSIFFVFLLILAFTTLLFAFLESLTFYFLKITTITDYIFGYPQQILQSYTPMFFEKSSLKLILFLYHTYSHGK